MAQAGTVWVDVRGDTSKFIKDVGDAAQTAGRKLSGALGAGAKTVLSDIGTAAGVSAIGIGAIGGAAVKASTEFNKSMSGVSAVAGATAAELDLLREAALKAGADTVFSASQASEAEAELAKAGVSVSDILGGALAGSLGLAAAGQIDLAQAAEISAQALNIFGLAGDQTTRVADVLAAGANKSAADVAQLGDALRQGGLLAAQTGLTLEETAGVLSLFADNALIGSDAGTSLKTMLQRLAPTTGPAADAMRELGLDFFDAKGAFVGIEEVAAQLQDRLGGLSDEQRQTALTTIFGSDAVRGASILMEGGAAAVEEYTAAVTDQGAAARMAAEQLNNLAGDVEQFKGSVETSLIRIGDLFDGVNRGIVQSGTEVVNVFNDFAETPAWGAIERNINDLASIGGTRLQGLADGLSAALDNISAADVDRVFARIEGGFSRVSEAADGLEPVILGVGAALSSMALRSVPFIGALVPALSPLTGLLGGLVLGSKEGRDALAQLGERASELASGAGVELLESLSNLSGELSDGLISALSGIGNAAFDAAEVLGPVLADALDELGPPLADLIEAGSELVVNVLPVLAELAGSALPPAVDVLAAGLTIAADATELLADNLWLLVPAFAAFTAVKYGDQIGKIGTSLRGVADNALFLRDSIGQISATQGVSKLEALRGVASSTARETGGLASTLIGSLNPAVVAVTGAVAVGTAIYLNYADGKRKVADAADSVAEALRAEADEFNNLNDEAARNSFADGDALDAVNELGLSLNDLSDVSVRYKDEVADLNRLFIDNNSNLRYFRASLETLPAPLQDIGEQIADLIDSGKIDEGQAARFFEALDNLAQGSAESIAAARAEFRSLAQEAAADGAITAEQLTTALDAIANAETPEELNHAFNLLQGFLGGTADQADRAANAIRGVVDELDRLAGAARDVDEAQRRYNDSINAVLESVARNGAGIDANTESGRRNADAIQGMVEAGEALAAAQAQTDVTGETSRKTYEGLASQLLGLRDAGYLTAEQYQQLLDLYDLTPTDIQTRVTADTDEAKAKLAEIEQQILDLPGLSEPEKAKIVAELNSGNIQGVEALLNALARDRESKIFVSVVEAGGDAGAGAGAAAGRGAARLTGADRQISDAAASAPKEIQIQVGLALKEGRVGDAQNLVNLWFEDLADGNITNPLLVAFGLGGRRAMGGPVKPGEAYMVGERGPELIVPQMAGTVLTADQTAGLLADTKVQTGSEFTGAMLAELQSLRSGLQSLASAVATARPITITETASARRTAEQLVVHESRLLRTAGV